MNEAASILQSVCAATVQTAGQKWARGSNDAHKVAKSAQRVHGAVQVRVIASKSEQFTVVATPRLLWRRVSCRELHNCRRRRWRRPLHGWFIPQRCRVRFRRRCRDCNYSYVHWQPRNSAINLLTLCCVTAENDLSCSESSYGPRIVAVECTKPILSNL